MKLPKQARRLSESRDEEWKRKKLENRDTVKLPMLLELYYVLIRIDILLLLRDPLPLLLDALPFARLLLEAFTHPLQSLHQLCKLHQ